MANIFRQHKQRIEAKASATAQSENTKAPSSIIDQMRLLMSTHKTELKAIQSLRAKAEKKAEFIPEYKAYIAGVLESGSTQQDDIVMTILIWAIDAKQFAYALQIAEWALKAEQLPPAEFSRDIQTILAEQVAEAALSDKDNIADFGFPLSITHDLVKGYDMPDQVRAKLNKALSFAHEETDPQAALLYAYEAESFDNKSGVKKLIKSLEKRVAEIEDDENAKAAAAAKQNNTDGNSGG